MKNTSTFNKILSFGEFEGDGLFEDFNPTTDFRFSVFSDLHYGYQDYNVFTCREGINKLNAVLGETQNSEFYLNLGDFADNLADQTDGLYVELQNELLKNNIVMYNGTEIADTDKRIIYSVAGNHEVAYMPKSILAPYMPYKDGIGNVYAFTRKDVVFLGYDAIFSAATGTDLPKDVIKTLQYTIPESVLDYTKQCLAKAITDATKSIVAFTHVSCKCILEPARSALFSILTSFGLPVVIFEGHAHRENYQLFQSETGETVQVFTLPAVTDLNTFNHYDVVMRNGKLLRINQIESPFNK
jgi:hypothetical protein